jgi:hypothetical protein
MTEASSSESVLFLKNKKGTVILLLVIFLLAGIGIRLIDFTDLPLDFAVTRQFHSLIMARGLYYQMDTPDTLSMPQDLRQFGITSGKSEPVIEPPILENLVAFTYRLSGGENIFVGRVYSILFWVIGGIPIFLLARRLMSVNGAFATLAFYLFIPFGVFASRSFQPDPMMVMFILWALYFQIRWFQEDTLKNSLLAGIFTGLAFLVKAPTAFFIGFPFAGLILSKGFKYWIKNKRVYLMAAISVLPGLVYNLVSSTVGGNAGSIFGARFFPQLFISLRWYLDWLQMINKVAGLFPLVIGLLAFFLINSKEKRVFYGCLWLGYLIYGFAFAYHIYTHNYYQLPLLPILALGMGFVFSLVFEKLESFNKGWLTRVLTMLILVFSLGLCVQHVRGVLVVSDYRPEAAYWKALGEKIGNNAQVVALTHDYGYRINYWGHISPTLWPTAADRTVKVLEGATDPAFVYMFRDFTQGKDVFLVTLMGEFNNQPDLKQYLMDNYPFQEGDGYFIFDLDHPYTVTQ